MKYFEKFTINTTSSIPRALHNAKGIYVWKLKPAANNVLNLDEFYNKTKDYTVVNGKDDFTKRPFKIKIKQLFDVENFGEREDGEEVIKSDTSIELFAELSPYLYIGKSTNLRQRISRHFHELDHFLNVVHSDIQDTKKKYSEPDLTKDFTEEDFREEDYSNEKEKSEIQLDRMDTNLEDRFSTRFAKMIHRYWKEKKIYSPPNIDQLVCHVYKFHDQEIEDSEILTLENFLINANNPLLNKQIKL